jgi:replicative DNA helicase
MNEIYSIQIERHVLGGIIKNPKLFADIERYISEHDFINEVHNCIFCVLRNTITKNESVDTVILAQKIDLMGIGFKDDINIYDYLESISFTSINAKGLFESAQELAKLSVRRNLHHKCSDIQKFLLENGEKEIDEIVSTVDSLYGDHLKEIEVLEKEPELLLNDIEAMIEERGDNPQEESGFSTPYEEFNRMYGGLRPGNLYAIVARPGQGKSTFIMDLCRKISTNNKVKALILDTEMDTQDVKFRIASALTGASLWHLETGKWRQVPELVEKVREAFKKIGNCELYHYPVGNKTIDQLCSFARRWKMTHVKRGESFVLGYDYVKLTGERVGSNWAEYQAIGDKVDKLKKLAEELNCPIITAMQMNRSGENFNRRAGGVTDDSSAIAQSDRLQWFASFVGIFRRKTVDEIASDGEDFGTHKLITLKTRFQGKDAAGHHDLVRRTDENGNVRFENNFLNFDVRNFNVEEVGSAADLAERERMQYSLQDGSDRDGDLM